MKHLMTSDGLKLKHTPFFLIHLGVPLLSILVFTGYQLIRTTPVNGLVIYEAKAVILVLPIMIALVTSLVADQEVAAGHGFFLLSATSRTKAFISKLVLLLLLGTLAVFFSLIGLFLVTKFIGNQWELDFQSTLYIGLLISSCMVFEYFLHTLIAFKFSKQINFSLAIIEFLLAALMITSLGEFIWILVPSSWGLRLMPIISSPSQPDALLSVLSLTQIIGIIILLTIVMALLFFFFTKHWEGREEED